MSIQTTPPAQIRAGDNQILASLIDEAKQHFTTRFARPPRFLVAAPGRVNLIGEHIDYNDGFVLPMAIERYVLIAADLKDNEGGSSSERTLASFYSCNLNQQSNISLTDPTASPNQVWSNYVAGVIAGFLSIGQPVPAIDAAVISNVPIGGGLSSSAALEVAVATLLEEITGTHLQGATKAKLCQHAEHEFAGMPCGIMDQFSSVFGRTDQLMLIDCRSHSVEMIPFPGDDISVLVTNSNVSHQLTSGGYATRRAQADSALKKLQQTSWRNVSLDLLNKNEHQLTATEFRRALHIVTETERTWQTANAFKDGDWDMVGKLMYDSHRSLRDDYEVSCPELNLLEEIARGIGSDRGVIGARMTGGGFGGCTVTLVERKHAKSVANLLAETYRAKTGITPYCFTSRPAQGAQAIMSKL